MRSRTPFSLSAALLSLALAPGALASTIWYVSAVNGSDSNSCSASTSACKTIGRAVSIASSGDSIVVAGGTYSENFIIRINVNLIGSPSPPTIIDGGGRGTVLEVASTANVTLSQFTIQNGRAITGAGIVNYGALTIIASTITNNTASGPRLCYLGQCSAGGGGIANFGTMTINNSTVTANSAYTTGTRAFASGGGISNGGTLTLNNTTVTNNSAYTTDPNTISAQAFGGGINNGGTVIVRNSIIAYNSSWVTKPYPFYRVSSNCYRGGITSEGYNLSSDATCSFSGPGDLNSTDPKLGSLGFYGGPTETIPLLSGSPAIDAGNPNGCTDNQGILLKTDQRAMPRPDSEDKGGCDMGAYESQTD